MNKNIASSMVTDIVGDERGDAFRASPSLVAWIFLEYYVGMPWESPIVCCRSLVGRFPVFC